MNKTILLAIFISKEKIDSFKLFLYEKFGINEDKIFCYKNLNDDTNLIFTFKLPINKQKPINIKKIFKNSVTIHKNGNALYTINAVNKLIKLKYPESIGNIDNKSIKIDWTKYQDKFMLTKDNKLSVLNISRVF